MMKFRNFWIILIVCISILITVSGLCILIRAFAVGANDNIGLYEETSQNQFEENIAINYILDITIIILTSISICFVHRINVSLKKIKPQIVVINKPQPPQPIILIRKEEFNVEQNVVVTTSNCNLQHPVDVLE